MYVRFILLVLALWMFSAPARGQTSWRKKRITVQTDSIVIDTLSLVPGSVTVKSADSVQIDTAIYRLVPEKALLIWKVKPQLQSVWIEYRTFPFLFSRKYFNKDPAIISESVIDNRDQYVYKVSKPENTLFNLGNLSKSGSLSRSIGFGNNQDLSVNSNMVLQLSGKLSNDIEILAAISDDNIPIQPEGNTQQINDFDKVFIQLKRRSTSLIAGDYELRRPDSYFMNFFKRTQGGEISTAYKVKGWDFKTTLAAAVAKGRWARNSINGVESNQGPYRLSGNNGEQYIIILSGSERVYLDGQLLVRGQENDYVIDYNTSELTFTPKRIITQNSRIIVEFEYSDKNYARTLTYFNQEAKGRKLAFRLNYYNEQDNPNQPFLQTLSDNEKQFLKGIGNNISQAYYLNADSVPFNTNEILYKKIDTLGNQNVYVYSTDPQLAKYRLGFSYVGSGNGNYRLNTSSAANGRVFEFVAPVGGVKQGDYEPVTLLVTPKKQQLITLANDYRPNKHTLLSHEIAFSNNDVNLFSTTGNQQNHGIAYRVYGENESRLSGSDSTGLKLKTKLNIELTGANFKAIERYRPVEFERDFNLYGLDTSAVAERLGSFSVGLVKSETRQINYQLTSFNRSEVYSGLQHAVTGMYSVGNYRVSYTGNLLHSSSILNNARFFRQTADVSRKLDSWVIGVNLQQENNRSESKTTNLLDLSSFAFTQYKLYTNNSIGKGAKFRLEYSRRYDKLPSDDALLRSSVADVIESGLELNKNPNSILSVSATYRNVDYRQFVAKQNESTLLGRAEYTLNAFKGLINSYTFYELGTGQEPKREFTYLEVQAGQGVYAWVDYNQNGIKELNEFEIARYPDQARYIRIYQVTNEFISTRYTSVNQTLRLQPSAVIKSKQGMGKLVAKFSSQTELKIDRKFTGENGFAAYNPIDTHIDAADLISLNSYFRNTLFFNRNDPVYGIDINVQQNGSKALLTNGFDTRKRTEAGLRLRWNLVQKTSLTVSFNRGNKRYDSELFTQNNYAIRFNELKPELSYLFNTNFRLTFSGTYGRQQNSALLGGEKNNNLRIGAETRYNILKKGVLTAQLNMVKNRYTGTTNSPVSYELLDGLQPGNNMVWNAGLQRSVANGIQLSVTYEGRKSPGVNVIHTGGVQVRAFF
ncbi:hypothetical protein FW774_15470 [Pedobacter sp. BS3]|uniref:hypothetical protein n=1 Tax=Pedobacter sp. BS3 TaxID=2567937 RepID=UPI0011ED04EE|nr:hypothetical protein [Pedobacter sp. BS3]TZF82091.1 hypothetical protein FW774_15470 [Pedobacter sp. BS3]